MLRRLIVFTTVMLVALFLMFLQNKVLVGEQEMQALLQPLPAAENASAGERVYKVTFADLGGNIVLPTAEDQQVVVKRLSGSERLAKIPVKSVSDITADHAILITAGADVQEDDLKRRLQGVPFKRANEAKSLLHVNPGIDLRGGVEFICQLRDDNGKLVPADDEVMHVLRSRLDERGLTEPVVSKLSNGDVQVVIPGGTRADAARTRKVLEDTGRLEFREVLEEYPYVQLGDPKAKVIVNAHGAYEFAPDVYRNRGDIIAPKRVEPGFTPTHFFRLGKAELTGKDVKEASQTLQEGEQAVGIQFTAPGATRNEQFTLRLYQTGPKGSRVGTGRLGILFDGVVQSDPIVQSPSRDHCVITGHFTQDEIDRLRTSLRAGSLTVVPQVISERVVGATLGVETVQRAMFAMIASFFAIALFMALYYRRLGTVANLCLVVTSVLIFATLSIFSATVTLPGLAGLVLSIGMAVDTNILVFERIREELREDKGLPYAIDRGYDRAFLTILDAHLTTFITALILYYIGSGPVKGFGLTLMVGIVINMFSGIYVGRMITDWLCKGRDTVTMAGWVPPLMLPYVAWRHVAYVFSFGTGILGAGYFMFGHLLVGGSFQRNFDIDFTGGNMVQVVFKEPKDLSVVEKAVKEALAAHHQELPLIDDLRMQFYIASLGADMSSSRQWVFRGRDEAGSVLEAERNKLEEKRKQIARRAEALRNETPPNEVEARKLDKDAEAKSKEILDAQHKISQRTAEFQHQLASVFTGSIAPEGEEVLAAAVDGNKLNLSVAMLEAPTADQATNVATALAKRAEYAQVTAKPLPPPAAGIAIEATWRKAPGALAQLPLADPALDRLVALLGGGTVDDQVRGRARAAFELYNAIALQAASHRLTVAQPFPASEHFSGQVADQMKIRALIATFLSLLAIMVYVAARFEFRFGIGSVVALFHDVVLTVGILSLLGVRIDLNVIAAILTIIGFSINDTIVTFDRVRENLPRMVGKTLAEVIDHSIAQTMSRTVLTSGTVIATVAVLYLFGGDALHAFSLTLLIGFTLGTYSSVFVAAPLLLTFKKQEPPAPPSSGAEIIVTDQPATKA
ncbi:MAG TPA: protein translocase subunit SecD [Planctomycetota bacterium]|nr:protein translocase subunit SecD [Planctomycetota bacterium]